MGLPESSFRGNVALSRDLLLAAAFASSLIIVALNFQGYRQGHGGQKASPSLIGQVTASVMTVVIVLSSV